MPKPENVVNHWHFFPQDGTQDNNKRVDVCEQGDGNFVVWVLETDGEVNFDDKVDAIVFAKLYIMARYCTNAVGEDNFMV